MRLTCSFCDWSSLPFGGPVMEGVRYDGPGRDDAFMELGQHLSSVHRITTVVGRVWLEQLAQLPNPRQEVEK
jgi:hypothetical protein